MDADEGARRGLSSLLQLQTDVGQSSKTVDDATQLLLEGIIGEGLDSNLTVIGLVNNRECKHMEGIDHAPPLAT